ncbi:MAG: glycosyltransferase family 2 protein [Bacteroidota bacterium]
MTPLQSLSIFFPCYNDAGTIASLVLRAESVGRAVAVDFEIIVIDDGSTDGSRDTLHRLMETVPALRVVLHDRNLGYGGALRSGFDHATKEWVFYTDGDGQYDVGELSKLVACVADDVDWVNGFKIKRHDPLHRIVLGLMYQYLMKFLFMLKIKDVDCDFRLVRKSSMKNVVLTHSSGVICVEMVRKFQEAGLRCVEVGVNHYFRVYGKSQIFNMPRLFQVVVNLIKLWFELMIFRKRGIV